MSTVAAAVVIGCSGATPAPTTDDQRTAARSRSAAAPELTSDNLAALERGLRREIEAVRDAQERSRTGKTPQERIRARRDADDAATIRHGAQAAGMSVAEYEAVRGVVTQIFQTLDFQEKIDGPLSVDMSRVSEERRKLLAGDPFDDVSPTSAAALRAHMPRLVPVWIEYVTITAVAG